ncbi:MAG: hypothetical protein IJX62_02250 [Clostridia bacterium]|nr:hypothetical protein [Clostridia bacterium]
MKFPFRHKFSIREPSRHTPVSEIPQNEYYEQISAKLGILQVILYLSLLAFVVLSFMANTNLITYQNFYHFFKDLNASAEAIDVTNTDSVSYPADEEQSFTLYRKGLAVAGNHSVTVFTATGRQTVSQSVNYQNPIAVGAGKYLLVYDLGGTQYSLYNSYTQVYAGKADYPIHGATVSNSGTYALISSSAEYTSVVSLYNDRFALINRYNKVGYVTDVAINDRGNLIALLTSTPQNGAFVTDLMICEPGKTEPRAQTQVSSSLGLSCHFTEEGTVAVVYSGGLTFVTQAGKTKATYPVHGLEPVCVDLADGGVSICLRNTEIAEKNDVWIFDGNGKQVYQGSVPETISQIAKSGNTVYLASDAGLWSIHLKTGGQDFSPHNTDKKILLAVNENEFLLCSPQKAEYIRTKN